MRSLKIVFVVVVAVLLSLGQSQTFPYASFMGQTLANHSYVDLTLVGSDVSGSDSVQCHTDLRTCCSGAEGSHRGDWYFPNGETLFFSDMSGIFQSRQAQKVDLRRRSGTLTSGIYRCDIQTFAVHNNTDNRRDTVYVGLYSTDQGN